MASPAFQSMVGFGFKSSAERPTTFSFEASADRPILSTRQYARIVDNWVAEIGLDPAAYGTHSTRPAKPSLIYRRTKNLRAVQLSAMCGLAVCPDAGMNELGLASRLAAPLRIPFRLPIKFAAV
jgi:hypothetical protein